ncbi:RNB domain-containing ribonuclease [Oerskovia turbata]|uniref:RNB domain-containing ribonuclease n=2 Tax=Oerskovia turbata TaxID=1713 RepID=A0A4Q1KV44_9CELL|nr:RNB domain-containing ribonuclease [Oerskovia turbata]RXR33309.1 RNB domain-containing ribonuclease [Oerskovia turbata]TGJ96525.1 ribonuclease II [Actinotalea fermentans ATCC 43279 = JCM 9966 = DSM 3133]
MEIPAEFPRPVLEEAAAAAQRDVTAGRADLRDVPFVTIDPPGSMDLDQALHLERRPGGYLVRYAIADLAAFVTPGGALDAEVHERGMTLYGPDERTPLHPAVLSEAAASLLPDTDRAAAVWHVELDDRGEIEGARVGRALVRSTARLTYEEVQTRLDAGDAGEMLDLLREVGLLREACERERGGVSLDVPEQDVVAHEDGSFGLEFRSTLPVEGWNAQISLLTGIAAARIMRTGGVGIFRTLPAADPRDLARLRRTAGALGIDWPRDLSYGELLATLDSASARHAAFLNEATSLFRGASYAAFGGTGQPAEVPDDVAHAAIAAEYAHVTAPLRRLVDRYGTEICLALCADEDVPVWVRDALPGLPRTMARTGQRAGSYERASVDIVEAALLTRRVGDVFDAVVVDVEVARAGAPTPEPRDVMRGQVVIADPAVRASVEGPALPLGDRVRVRLRDASIERRRVVFDLA